MHLSFDNWFLFPPSILISTTAMASGIGGAVFFSPTFLLGLKLEPSVAIGTALLTELFGFSSGLTAYLRAKRIDFKLAAALLMFSIPGAVVGVLIMDEQQEHASQITDRDGHVYRYTVCNKALGRTFAAVGGVFLGMISVGLAELQEYHLVAKCRVPPPVAVATSIFVVVGTVLVAVIGHGHAFMTASDTEVLAQVANVAIFTVPGVLIGGQLEPKAGALLNPDKLKVSIAVLFMLVGGFMLATLAM